MPNLASPLVEPALGVLTPAWAAWLRDVAAGAGGSGAAVWGGITGTLSAQADLQATLDAKADDGDLAAHVAAADPHTGYALDADLATKATTALLGSDYAAIAGGGVTFRSNLALFAAQIAPLSDGDILDLLSTASAVRGAAYNAGSGLTNAPPGYTTEDRIFVKGFDTNNLTVVWLRSDAAVFMNVKTAGAWYADGWRPFVGASDPMAGEFA